MDQQLFTGDKISEIFNYYLGNLKGCSLSYCGRPGSHAQPGRISLRLVAVGAGRRENDGERRENDGESGLDLDEDGMVGSLLSLAGRQRRRGRQSSFGVQSTGEGGSSDWRCRTGESGSAPRSVLAKSTLASASFPSRPGKLCIEEVSHRGPRINGAYGRLSLEHTISTVDYLPSLNWSLEAPPIGQCCRRGVLFLFYLGGGGE